MEHWTPWKIIKAGFFLGIGFVLPLAVMEASVFGASFYLANSAFEADYGEYEELTYEDSDDISSEGSSAPSYPDFDDYADKIELGDYSHRMQGNQLLITGSLTNNAKVEVSSIQLEAELFDGEGTFIYECSEYMRKEIPAGKSENFMIKCGCSKNGLPEFERFELAVVSADTY